MKIGRPETALSAFHCGRLSQRHARVDRVAAVAGAGQARFAARRGAAVRRAVGVDQGHPVAGAEQMVRGPGAEHAGADHGDMGSWSRSGAALAMAGKIAAPPAPARSERRVSVIASGRSTALGLRRGRRRRRRRQPGRRRSPGSPSRPRRSASPEVAAAAAAAAARDLDRSAVRAERLADRQADRPRLADVVAEPRPPAALAIERQLRILVEQIVDVERRPRARCPTSRRPTD